jgi:hypothetical protein
MQWIPVSPTETLIREIAYVLPDTRREMKAARYLNWRINRRVNAEDTELVARRAEGYGLALVQTRPAERARGLPAGSRPQIACPDPRSPPTPPTCRLEPLSVCPCRFRLGIPRSTGFGVHRWSVRGASRPDGTKQSSVLSGFLP